MTIKVFILLWSISSLPSSQGSSDFQSETDILRRILNESKYDSDVRPPGNSTSEPTFVTVYVYVRTFEFFDDINMRYRMQFTLRTRWMDKRLSHARVPYIPYLTLTSRFKVWTPDMYFSNELESHTNNLMKSPKYTRIFPNGDVRQQSRMTLTLACPMNLMLFPRDTQTCSMKILSYAFTTADIIFKWYDLDSPVYVAPYSKLPKFSFQQFNTSYCDDHSGTGICSCLQTDFIFKREFNSYLFQVYIPTTALVGVAYLSFWIDRRETFAKVFLSTSSLLMLILATILLSLNFPATPYLKAIDIWMGVCISFALGAVVTCTLVNYCKIENCMETSDKSIETQESKKGRNTCSSTFFSRTVEILARVVYLPMFFMFILWHMSD